MNGGRVRRRRGRGGREGASEVGSVSLRSISVTKVTHQGRLARP